jgi:hypothetical protein
MWSTSARYVESTDPLVTIDLVTVVAEVDASMLRQLAGSPLTDTPPGEEGSTRTASNGRRTHYETPNLRRITSPLYRKIFRSAGPMKRWCAMRPRMPSGGR